MPAALIPLSVVAIVYGGINTLVLALTDQVFSVRGSHFLNGVFVLTTSIPVGIIAALFWFRGIRAKRTTIRHGGFVGFYTFLVTLLNPAAWLLYAGSFFMAFWLNAFLLPFLGFWCGRAIGAAFHNIQLDRTRDIIPKNLDLAIYKRNWFHIKFGFACMSVAWLIHRPTEIPQILVSALLGGGILWFLFASPLMWRVMHHRMPIVRGLVLVVSLAVGVWGIST